MEAKTQKVKLQIEKESQKARGKGQGARLLQGDGMRSKAERPGGSLLSEQDRQEAEQEFTCWMEKEDTEFSSG